MPGGAVSDEQCLSCPAGTFNGAEGAAALNAATDLGFLRHTLDTYNEIANFLRQDYFMRVSDVDAAFPLLPLHPDLWPFFLFRFALGESESLSLFVHLCADFGAAGTPGVFKIFFVD